MFHPATFTLKKPWLRQTNLLQEFAKKKHPAPGNHIRENNQFCFWKNWTGNYNNFNWGKQQLNSKHFDARNHIDFQPV